MTKKEKFIEFVNELMELAEFNEWHGSWKEDYKDAIDFFEELKNNKVKTAKEMTEKAVGHIHGDAGSLPDKKNKKKLLTN